MPLILTLGHCFCTFNHVTYTAPNLSGNAKILRRYNTYTIKNGSLYGHVKLVRDNNMNRFS